MIFIFLFTVYEQFDEMRISIHLVNLELQYSNRHITQSLWTQEFEAMKHGNESYIDIILHPVPQRLLKSIF